MNIAAVIAFRNTRQTPGDWIDTNIKFRLLTHRHTGSYHTAPTLPINRFGFKRHLDHVGK